MSKNRFILIFVLSLLLACQSIVFAKTQAPPLPQKPDLPQLLPPNLEIEQALSAGPETIRENTTVYILERGGYIKAQQGTNGFTCIVRRMGVTPFSL